MLFYPTLYYLSIPSKNLGYNFLGDAKMKPLKEKISITIDSDLLTRAKQEAENDDRSLSQYINLILREHFRKLDDNTSEKYHAAR